MKDFWKKASKYASEAKSGEVFNYEGSQIQADLLLMLLATKDTLDCLTESYEKEADYNRLLRAENASLKDYAEDLERFIEQMTSEDTESDENNFFINIDGGDLLS